MENRSIAMYILVALVLLGIGYGVWNGVINKGTIAISSAAPFSAQIDSDPAFICQASPCEFRVKTGSHGVSIRKEGFSDYSKLVGVSIQSRVEVKAELEKIVKAEVISAKFTAPKIENPFALRKDTVSGLQAVVKKANTGSEAKASDSDEVIAYFSRPFENPKILTNGAQSVAWVIDNGKKSSSIYKVDVQKKSRTLVYETKNNIRGIVPSESGKSVAVVLGNSIDLVTINNGAVFSVTLSAVLDSEKLFAWKNDNVFFYVARSESSVMLKRGYVDNLQQQDSIRAWLDSEDTIGQIFNDTKGTKGDRLVVIGKNASYAVEY